MNKRGRKNKADELGLNVIEGDFGPKRPDPPDDMQPRQKELWLEIVNDEPVSHFATAVTKQLLKDYCFSRMWIEAVQIQMNEFPPDALRSERGRKVFQSITKSLAEHCRTATSLATKLRLTNQSRYTPQTADTASRNTLKGLKPWEI